MLIEPAVATLTAAYAADRADRPGDRPRRPGGRGRAEHAGGRSTTPCEQAGAEYRGATYYWELSTNPYYSATSATFIGQILGLFGLKNIADAADKPADGGYPELSEEYIVTARPQLIFLADNQPADGGQTPAIVARRPGWAGLPAVQDHDIFGLNDDIASRWGPRLPALVDAIAQRAREQRQVVSGQR